jgi:hypothetical protein
MHEIQIHNGFNNLPFTLRMAAYFVPISISSHCWHVDTQILMQFLKQFHRYAFKCLRLDRQNIRNYKSTNIDLEHTDQLTDHLEVIYKCQLCSYSRTSQHFMEPEGSLPSSQEPSTGPYPEPDQSNPYHPILSL